MLLALYQWKMQLKKKTRASHSPVNNAIGVDNRRALKQVFQELLGTMNPR